MEWLWLIVSIIAYLTSSPLSQNSRSRCWLLSRSPTTLEMKWNAWKNAASFEGRCVVVFWKCDSYFEKTHRLRCWPIFVLISSNSWHRALPRLVRRPPHRSRCWRRTWWKGRRARAARHLRPPPPPSRTSPSSPSSRWAWSVRQRVTYTFTSCSRLQQYPQINLRWILLQFHFSAERMCAERVEQVRAEYDQILQQKLSEQVSFWLLICLRYTWSHCYEFTLVFYIPFSFLTLMSPQYDAFVKFIDHQIQKRFNESMAPSYLS